MKRIELTEKQQNEVMRLYFEENKGVIAVGNCFNVSRTVIKRVIVEKGLKLKNMSECHKGQQAWNKGRPHSAETCRKIALKAINRFGENNPNWKGGKQTIRDKRRNLKIVKEWRKKCLILDNNQCRWCLSIERLEVNHIIPIRQIKDIELLCDINNGITLCRKCHYKIHYHEYEYTEFLRKLIKNRVNSGETSKR